MAKQYTVHCARALAVIVVGLSVVCLAVAAEPAKTPEQTDPAREEARKQEATAREDENSREMARSATREIARSERNRSEDALRKWRVADAAVQQAIADKKPEDQLAELRAAAQARLTTVRDATVRLFADTIAANKASDELFVSESALRDKMAATRTIESRILDEKAKAAAARTVELTAQPGQEKEAQAQAQTAATLLRELNELEALRVMEIQQWTQIRKDTAEELVEQSRDAARIATEIAAVETDAEQKQRLEQFAAQQEQDRAAAELVMVAAVQAVADAAAEIYAFRAAAMGGLKPLAPDQWDYAKARHLLVRAGFGGTPQQVEQLCAMGLYKAVDHLVEFYHQPASGPTLDPMPLLNMDPLQNKMRVRGVGNRAVGLDSQSAEANQIVQVRRWWLQRLVESPRPLQEKLTLFWHGHFASQNSVVQNSYTMFRQNQFFRDHAAGNFGALLYGIVHDPAMIRYLDNNKNVKGSPNENLAREIMELFAMGVDQGYTEKDIVEAARALTGYNYDHATGTYRFLYSQHDATDKTIFGQTGPWTGDDLVRLILERPETSRFIGRKLFEYFAYPDPDKATVDSLADVLKGRQYELTPLLKNVFLSEEFYSSRAMGKQVKSPVELMVGLLRDLGTQPLVVQQSIETPLSKSDGSRLVVDRSLTSYETLDLALGDMGLQLMEPPDVKGWRYGRPWIDSQRLFARYNAVASLIDAVGQQGVDVVSLIQAAGCQNGTEAVDYLAKACLMQPLDADERSELIGHLGELPPSGEWESKRGEVNEKLRSVLMLMLCVPEHQMS